VEGNIGLLSKLAAVDRNKDKERKMNKKLKSMNSLTVDEKIAVRGMVGKAFEKH
jgi:hypothetical protein